MVGTGNKSKINILSHNHYMHYTTYQLNIVFVIIKNNLTFAYKPKHFLSDILQDSNNLKVYFNIFM